jgi:diaminopimelate epimerase
MEPIEFWKMSGSGNDFILIDNRKGIVPEQDMSRLVEQSCRRRESVGADGVIFVTDSKEYDFGWRFFNADGGEVEMCGNGGRCVSRFACLKGIAGSEMTFETQVGPISAQVEGRVVKVLMPEPRNERMDVDLEMLPGWRSCDFVNTGVPHVVVQVADLENHPVLMQGREIRYHKLFSPEGTNANFMTVMGPDELVVRTYERGVEDETLACGTGAIASALMAYRRGMVVSPVKVHTQGGEILTIHLNSGGNGDRTGERVWLQGNTSVIYMATLHDEAL